MTASWGCSKVHICRDCTCGLAVQGSSKFDVQLVNELCKQDAPRDSCIAVLPLGTANDLATSLGIPSDDLVKAMQIAVAGELIMMVPSTLHAFC